MYGQLSRLGSAVESPLLLDVLDGGRRVVAKQVAQGTDHVLLTEGTAKLLQKGIICGVQVELPQDACLLGWGVGLTRHGSISNA